MKFRKIYTIFTSLLMIVTIFGYTFAQSNTMADFLNLKQFNASFFEAYEQISTEQAWNAVNSASNTLTPVKIGIIDSGIDGGHPEFEGVNLGNTPPNALRDFATKPEDDKPSGHGTQVAGIIGANNILGTGGLLDPDSPQMNGIVSGIEGLEYTLEIRRPNFFGFTSYDVFSVADQMEDLIDEEVDIINYSASGTVPVTSVFVTDMYAQIFFKAPDILFVLAAGQFGENGIDAELVSPPNLGDNFDNVLTVAAVDLDDQRFVNSNFGSPVGIAAPGIVYAPAPRGNGSFPESGPDVKNYETAFGGTSAAAPMVTGVAAILKAIDPNLTPQQISGALELAFNK